MPVIVGLFFGISTGVILVDVVIENKKKDK